MLERFLGLMRKGKVSMINNICFNIPTRAKVIVISIVNNTHLVVV
jgi:hypothetical protein